MGTNINIDGPFVNFINLNIFGEPELFLLDDGRELTLEEMLKLQIKPCNINIYKNYITLNDYVSTVSIVKNSDTVGKLYRRFKISNQVWAADAILESVDMTDTFTGETRTYYSNELVNILHNNIEFRKVLKVYEIDFYKSANMLIKKQNYNNELLKHYQTTNKQFIGWENNYLAKAKLLGKLDFNKENIGEISSSLEELKLPPTIVLIINKLNLSNNKKIIIPDNTIKIGLPWDSVKGELDFGKSCCTMTIIPFKYAQAQVKKIRAQYPIQITDLKYFTRLEELELPLSTLDSTARYGLELENLKSFKFIW